MSIAAVAAYNGLDEKEELLEEQDENDDKDVWPELASDIRKGDFILIDGETCEVYDISHTRAGRHGGHRFTFTGTDVFTQEKRVLANVHPFENVDEVKVKVEDHWVMEIDDNGQYATILENADYATKMWELPIPDGLLGDDIRQLWNMETVDIGVLVLSANGKEKIVGCTKKTDAIIRRPNPICV